MLGILISWLVCGFVFLVFGKLLINISGVFLKGNMSYGYCASFFLGICFVGTILSIFSIWIPINNIIGWVLFLIAVAYSFYSLKFKKDYFLADILTKFVSLSVSVKLMVIFSFVTIACCCLLPPSLVDMRLYYLQNIMWNEAYPVIPGLGNIHGRFGFNSNILLLSSAFSFSDVFSMRIYGILGISTFALIFWVITKIEQAEYFFTKVALVFFCFAFVICYQNFISSPSTDILPNVIVSFILLKAFLDRDSLKKSPLIYSVLPVYALTLKLSVIPICLFFLYIVIEMARNKQYKKILFLITLSLVVIAPWFARNIIITGYLIYPFPSIDIFSFDWKIPSAFAEEEKALVSMWAKMPGLSLEEFDRMSFTEWMKVWMLRHTKYMKIYTFVYCLAAISPAIVLWLRKTKRTITLLQLLPWAVAFCGFLFWFILAPDGRFGLSFILISGIAPLFFIKYNPHKAFLKNILCAAFCLSFVYIMTLTFDLHTKNRDNKTIISYICVPQTVEILNEKENTKFETIRIDNIDIYVPNNYLCSDHVIPCAPYINNNLEMRGNTVEEGFRIKTTNNIQ